MSKLSEYISFSANVLTITVLVAVVGIELKTYFQPKNPTITRGWIRGEVAPPLPGISYSGQRHTVVLFAKSTCPFCRVDLPFYKRIAEKVEAHKNANWVVVFPKGDAEAEAFLSSGGVVSPSLIRLDLSSVRIAGTPTLLLVDDRGRVDDFWIGLVPPSEQAKVLSLL